MFRPLLTAAAFAALALPANAQDLLIRGGTIHTGVENNPTAEVVIARDGRIAYVGSAADTPSTEGLTVVDLEGATLFPGFTDGHAHLDGIGWRELTLNLEGSTSVADAMSRLTAWAELLIEPDTPCRSVIAVNEELMPSTHAISDASLIQEARHRDSRSVEDDGRRATR